MEDARGEILCGLSVAAFSVAFDDALFLENLGDSASPSLNVDGTIKDPLSGKVLDFTVEFNK
jgi:hypothetical protein